MRRSAWTALLSAALLSTGCGDPIVVLGDAPGFMRVVAGIPDSLGVRIDSLALRTRLTDPAAVAFEPDRALLYVVDRGSVRQQGGITQNVARIMSVDSRSRLRLLVDGGGCSSGTCLHAATQMVPAPDGTFLIADPIGHRVMRFDPLTNALTVVAGTGANIFTPDGAPAASASLRAPYGVAIGRDGRIYISEQGASRVRYIDETGALRTLAGTGVAGYAGDGGPATEALLSLPSGLAVDADGVYIADAGSHTVRTVHLGDGTITTLAGTGGQGFSGDGGPAVLAQLYVPIGLVLSIDGTTLFIADRENHRIRVVNLVSRSIQTFAGSGSPQFSGSRGPAGDTSLRWPTGLAIAERGFLYIADTGHFVIWRAALTL
jgi:DNA-binding beta-propeller fold protein YncE